MSRSTIYYAAPLFTDAERSWNAGNAVRLRARFPTRTLALPQEFCAAFDAGPGAKPDFAQIFAACVDHLAQAAVVLAVIDGADPDSGTCWEAGYAYARGIPVISLRTDWRPAEDGAANCMLTRSSRCVARTLEEAMTGIEALER